MHLHTPPSSSLPALSRLQRREHRVHAGRLGTVVARRVVGGLADVEGLDDAVVEHHREPLGARVAEHPHRPRVVEHLRGSGPLSQGFKRVGRHSEYSIYTVRRCVRRGPGGSSDLFLPVGHHADLLRQLAAGVGHERDNGALAVGAHLGFGRAVASG
jgi:hypothetical protein